MMKSSSVNSFSSVSNKLSKPPVPPKPSLHGKSKSLSQSKQDLISHNQYPKSYCENRLGNSSHSVVGSETFPPPVEAINTKDTLNDVVPISIRVKSEIGIAKGSLQRQSSPMLVSSDANATVSSNFTRPPCRTLSASAKNALLMEKIGGTNPIYFNSEQENRYLPISEGNMSVTVNSTIISLNDFNDNAKNFSNNNFTTSYIDRMTHGVIVNGCTDIPSHLSDVPCESDALCPMKNEIQAALPTADHNNHLSSGIIKGNENKIICKVSSVNPNSYGNQIINSTINNHKNGYYSPLPVDEVDCYCDNDKISSSAVQIGYSQSAPCSPAAKPLLQKADAVDLDSDYYRKLSRGISRATDNVNIVSKARTELAQGVLGALDTPNMISNTPFLVETPEVTFTLPDLSVYSDEFRAFLEKDLIEMSTLVSLEAVDRLNWWAIIGASQRLWPLATSGDGNCLLHAASLAMWGFHDRLLMLRKALYDFLTRSPYSKPLWRRWRWQLTMQNRTTGLVYNQGEWEIEWSNVIRLASSTPRGTNHTAGSAPDLTQISDTISQGKLNNDCTGQVYESLEEIHVLALAHVLRRPIIVVADTTLKDVNGAPFAPITFGGIYLPLIFPPSECQRSPLLLTYDAAHFSALVVMESQDSDLQAVIPVTDCHHDLLPIQFLVDPGEDFTWDQDEHDPLVIQKLTITSRDKRGLLSEYLNLKEVPIPSSYLEAAASLLSADEPDSENFYNDIMDPEKKSSESSFESDEGAQSYFDNGTAVTKPKASKQLQTVVRQFGSIGRSMSKRIKKNFNTLSKLSRTGSFRKKNLPVKGPYGKGDRMVRVATHQTYILSAGIHIGKRLSYQEEMISNYLSTARVRFNKKLSSQQLIEEASRVDMEAVTNGDSILCINPGCNLFGTVETSYMCSTCFNRQKEEEEKEYQRQSSNETVAPSPTLQRGGGAKYGAGKSKFYTELDEKSVKNAAKIPVMRSLSNVKDKTIFLSNSTFYNDSVPIPSYNLNKSKLSAESSNSRSSIKSPSPKLSSPECLLRNSKSTGVKPNLRETLVPICIDEVRVQLNSQLQKREKGVLSNDAASPLSCLTNGCEFYGNSSTEGLCSMCHLARKKNMSSKVDSYNVEQAKYVQI